MSFMVKYGSTVHSAETPAMAGILRIMTAFPHGANLQNCPFGNLISALRHPCTCVLYGLARFYETCQIRCLLDDVFWGNKNISSFCRAYYMPLTTQNIMLYWYAYKCGKLQDNNRPFNEWTPDIIDLNQVVWYSSMTELYNKLNVTTVDIIGYCQTQAVANPIIEDIW